MTLSKADIQRELGYGDLEIEYEGDLNIEPSSVDLHLGDEIKTPLKQRRDVKVDMEATYPCFETVKTPFTIPPHGFALRIQKIKGTNIMGKQELPHRDSMRTSNRYG